MNIAKCVVKHMNIMVENAGTVIIEMVIGFEEKQKRKKFEFFLFRSKYKNV
jgi:hypothetical protein